MSQRDPHLVFLLGLCTALPFDALFLSLPCPSSLLHFSVPLTAPLEPTGVFQGMTFSSCLPHSNSSTTRSSASLMFSSQRAVLTQISFGDGSEEPLTLVEQDRLLRSDLLLSC